MRTAEDKLQSLVNFILSDVLNAPLEEESIGFNGVGLTVEGNELSHNDSLALVSEADTLQHMQLWKLLMKDLKRVAQQRIGAGSMNWEDVFFGKAMLYSIDVMEKKVSNLSRIQLQKKGRPPTKAA